MHTTTKFIALGLFAALGAGFAGTRALEAG
jgi:hypothetical protein